MAVVSEARLARTFGKGIMANHVGETFRWHMRRALHPLCPLLEDYRDLCPNFTLPDAEEAAHPFNMPEIVQATFYVMLLNDAVELYLVSRDMAGGLKSTLEGLQYTTFESWLSVSKRALLELSFTLPASSYKGGVELLMEDHLTSLLNIHRERVSVI
ncbi:hypothetical protein Cgig2_008887 [Carnegiea gigantea]|uniref:Uncharacterized protein n=1 Tax=Carnegiea gigantea TaxID=171969 RepID=A0A9Q1KJQ5_9CARY|nr:hypothetical protein Cgig2_008887 [Carnegiea gigantea]